MTSHLPPCSTCHHLREVTNPKHRDRYMRCGWADGRAFPSIGGLQWDYANAVREPATWMTRAYVEGKLEKLAPQTCDTYEPRDEHSA